MKIKEDYLAQVSGYVVEPKKTAFVVKAENRELAEEQAIKEFAMQNSIVEDAVLVDVQGRGLRTIIAMVALLTAVLIALLGHWENGHEVLYIAPDLTSMLFAVAFYAIFVIRFKGIKNAFNSIFDLVFFILVVLLLASLFRVVLFEQKISILGITTLTIDSKMLLIIACFFSLFGLKLISLICSGIIIIFAMIRIGILSSVMGLIGAVYIMTAFIGILAYLSLEPFVVEAMPFYKQTFKNISARVKSDVGEGAESLKRVSTSVKGKMVDYNNRKTIGDNSNEQNQQSEKEIK